MHSRESVKSKATGRSVEAGRAGGGGAVAAYDGAPKDKSPESEPKKDFIEENRRALAAKSKLTAAQKVFQSEIRRKSASRRSFLFSVP